MNPLLVLSIASSTFLGLCAVMSVLAQNRASATTQRVSAVLGVAPAARTEAGGALVKRMIAATAFWVRSHLGLSERGGLGERFTRAGFRGSAALDLYTAARIVGPLAMMMAGAAIPFARMFWVISLPAVAYLVPDWALSYVIRRRMKAIRRSMPDMLDLLVICVDAGLGLDQAMMRVAEELEMTSPEIHDELMQINREQRAGKPRMDAWQAMLERVKLPEVEAFVNMLLQTDRFGTPISRALSNFAANVRLQRTQKAEENAAKTTIKIIFPLVLFIFPSIFVVLLGPAALSIMHGLKKGF